MYRTNGFHLVVCVYSDNIQYIEVIYLPYLSRIYLITKLVSQETVLKVSCEFAVTLHVFSGLSQFPGFFSFVSLCLFSV